MESAKTKKSFYSEVVRLFNLFLLLFKEKIELVKKISEYEKKINLQSKEIDELKRENDILESKADKYKKYSDQIGLIEEFDSVDNIIRKAVEYDNNGTLIRDLEIENRKLEQENKKLKSLV